MKIDTTPLDTTLRTGLLSRVELARIRSYGQVRRAYVQRDKRVRLVTTEQPLQVVAPSTDYACQWAVQPQTKAYGTRSRGFYDAQFHLLLCSEEPELMEAVLGKLTELDCVVRQINADTLQVLRSGWELAVGSEKNYPPEWWAWQFRGELKNVLPIAC